MKVKLELSIEEANLVLNALAKLPYEVTFSLIDKIKADANSQLIAEKAEAVEATQE
jgi:hypothetical protein